jgi:hypothetical protein
MTSATLSRTPLREFLAESAHRIRGTLTRFYVRHQLALPWLSPVLVISAIVSFVNFGGAPQRIDDEGTYTAQAYAVSALVSSRTTPTATTIRRSAGYRSPDTRSSPGPSPAMTSLCLPLARQ